MLKRSLIILSLTIALVVAVEPLQTVHGVVLTGTEWLDANTVAPGAVNAANTASVPKAQSDGQGNGFLRALGAPFRAIGRLFGRKKNENKLERISEKEARRCFRQIQMCWTGPAASASVWRCEECSRVNNPRRLDQGEA